MSAEQMAKAADDQILALFEELTDDTGWDHPRLRGRAFVGGSIQASRAFAEFAGNAPERALGIIRTFEVETMERPAGAALAVLGDSAVPAFNPDWEHPETRRTWVRFAGVQERCRPMFAGDSSSCRWAR